MTFLNNRDQYNSTERRIIQGMITGKRRKQIAKDLGVTESVIHNHTKQMFLKANRPEIRTAPSFVAYLYSSGQLEWTTATPPFPFLDKELEVIHGISGGKAYREIGEETGRSYHSVRHTAISLMNFLKAETLAHLMAIVHGQRLLTGKHFES